MTIADRRAMALAALCVAVLTPVFFLSARVMYGSGDGGTALFRAVTLVGAVLIGYELFFTVQRTTPRHPPRIVRAPVDDRIPFHPGWVWVYGGLYYVIIAFPFGLFASARAMALYIAGGAAMLAIALPIYLVWPTVCPPEWRALEGSGASIRFLRFIQAFDNGSGCVPSLHVAFSAYASAFYPHATGVVAVPLVVGSACVLVKQHSILDLLPGWVLGIAVGFTINTLM